ncbi:MAG TPA: FtsX-like permease family protein, partial [Sphingomonas sp.]
RAPLARIALANLHRPGAQTGRLIVALGLGFSLFVALAVIDTSLGRQIATAAPAKAPRFFAIDLPPEDERAFAAAIRGASPGARIDTAPSLRGSVVSFNGVPVASMQPPPTSWVLRSERTLTWSATVPPNNRVVAGAWWPRDYRGPPLVSIGDDMAQALKLGVGDRITLSVLGVEVPARIAAVRQFDWTALGLNFAVVFSPGYIEEAPHALLASVYSAPDKDGQVARRVAAALPSVTMVRVGDIIGQVGDVLGRIVLAIRAAAAVTVVAGIVVLVGAVASSARTRRYDAVVLKLLGARRRQVLAVQAIEYAALALLLAGVAMLIGGAAGWYVVTQVFSLPFAPDWGIVAATLAVATFATLGIGIAGSLPVLAARPAESLRAL